MTFPYNYIVLSLGFGAVAFVGWGFFSGHLSYGESRGILGAVTAALFVGIAIQRKRRGD